MRIFHNRIQISNNFIFPNILLIQSIVIEYSLIWKPLKRPEITTEIHRDYTEMVLDMSIFKIHLNKQKIVALN